MTMDGYTSEPIYENVQKDMDDVTDIDERVIIFLNVVREAPRDIQKLTDNFLATVDKLKRIYISNIFKTKVIERKHTASEEYVESVVNEYNSLKRKDSYLDQVSSEDCHVVFDKLEQARLELAMRFCSLQLAVRELELSKEKLGRLSKRAEHNFIGNLQNHPDRSWAQVYKNDSQRHRSELKRVATVPAVLPKPALKLPHAHGSRDCKCCRRSASNVHVKSSNERVRSTRQCQTLKHVKDTTKVLTKTGSLEACVESYSSEEDFPAPPPPLAASECVFDTETPFNLVTTGTSKRLSDRSAVSDRSIVDEGIGDIDWNPSQGTSVCGSEADEKQRMAEIDNFELVVNNYENNYENTTCSQNENTTESDIYDDVMVDHGCESREMTSEIAITPDYENVETMGITADDNIIQVLPSTETTVRVKTSPLEVNVLHSNDVECYATTTNEKTMTHDDVLHSQLNLSEMTQHENTRHKVNSTELGTSLHPNEDISNTTLTDDIISDRLKGLKTTDVENGRRMTSSVDERQKNVYEDRSFLQTSHKHKKEKTKKKKKMTFLTKVFRGPWEGWESD